MKINGREVTVKHEQYDVRRPRKERGGLLVVVDHFLPGYEAGGPIRAIAGLVDALGDELQFRVLTKDRDLGATKPFQGISVDSWNRVGKADVYYASPLAVSLAGLRRIIRSEGPAIIYLNSIFSSVSARILALRTVRVVPRAKILIAPRGEFSTGAIRVKAFKKKIYLFVLRITGALEGATWHASSSLEATDIQREWYRGNGKANEHIVVAGELTARRDATSSAPTKRVAKSSGCARVVFLSRISPKKNLDGVLRILANVKATVLLDIIGPVFEQDYWRYCQSLIATLPKNIIVRYLGSIEHGEVFGRLAEYDLFFLPTFGENFGHAIVEALAAGCPVLLSDQTPWRDMAKAHAGWDLPLEAEEQFAHAIETVAMMSEPDHAEMMRGARQYAERIVFSSEIVEANRKIFATVGAMGSTLANEVALHSSR